MSDLIFKVPELPEDALLRKRKLDDIVKRKDCEASNASSDSLLSTLRMPCYSKFQANGDVYKDERVQPSTSRCRKVLGDNDDKLNIFQGSLRRSGNQNFAQIDMRGRYNNYMNITTRESEVNSAFSSKAVLPRMSNSVFENRTCNFDFSSKNFSDLNLIRRPGVQIPLHTNQQVCRRVNQHDYFGNRRTFNVNNTETSCSSLSMKKSVFHTGLLPDSNRHTKNFSIQECRNQISDSVNRTSVLQRGTLPVNTSQSVLQNQTMITSFIQSAVREQVMNALENFQHSLVLSNSPNLQTLFEKTAKEVKSIFENSVMYMNGDMGTMDMVSTLNYTSETSRLPQKSIMHKQVCQPSIKPNDVFRNLEIGRNESHKMEFVKSFVQENKRRNCTKDDIFEDVDITTSSLIINAKKASDKKRVKGGEVKQRDWDPIPNGKVNNKNNNKRRIKKLEESFSTPVNNITCSNDRRAAEDATKNTEDCRVLTTTRSGRIVKRPENRLAGETPSSGIPAKIKTGLENKPKLISGSIKDLKKSEKESEGTLMCSAVSGSAEHEISVNTTVRVKRSLRVGTGKLRDLNSSELRDFTSPLATKSVTNITRARDDPAIKSAQRQCDNKKKKSGERGVGEVVEGTLMAPPKGIASSNRKRSAEDSSAVDESSRVLTTTRSGRIVKRPGNLWIGGHFNSANTGNDDSRNLNLRNNLESNPSKDNKKKEVSQLKRKREVSDKTVIEVKKSKGGRSKEEGESQAKGKQSTSRKKKEKQKSNPVNGTVNNQSSEVLDSPISAKTTERTKRKPATKPAFTAAPNPWGNEIEEGLDDIIIPEMTSHVEDVKTDMKKLKMLTMETPPLKFLRSNLKILSTCTPVQSPNWQISQHTQSEVKKFEKLRAQTFKQKIPKEKNKKTTSKTEKRANNPVRNKDVDTVVNWIGEREVKTPGKCSKVIKYMIPKRSELESEDEGDDV